MTDWKCPGCGRCYSPDTKACVACNEAIGSQAGDLMYNGMIIRRVTSAVDHEYNVDITGSTRIGKNIDPSEPSLINDAFRSFEQTEAKEGY